MTRGPDGVHRISNSEAQTFKRCRRKWYLAYYRKLQLKERMITGPLALGTRIHTALAGYYSKERLNPLVVLEQTIAEDLETFPEQAEALNKEADLARAMIEGYMQWIAETGIDQGLVILAEEVRLEVDSGVQGVKLIGKLDVRVQREVDDLLLYVDHKTCAGLTTPLKTLHLDEQMLMYHLIEYLLYVEKRTAALEAGEPEPARRHTEGALYNMLRKVKRTATAKPPFYDRVEVRHNVHELRAFYTRLHGVIYDILGVEKALDAGGDPMFVAYPTPNNTCSWQCEFFPICPMFDDGSNAEAMLTEYYAEHDPLDRYKAEETTGEM